MQQLLDIMQALRNPESGCPWDLKQSFKSIVPYTLEEAYEVADAIEQGDMPALKSELGDLLFQVVFYAQMAKEQQLFDFQDVVKDISEKLIRRHPHVFDEQQNNTLSDADLHEAWETSKADERDEKAMQEKASILHDVAKALPALKRAQKLQKRAAREGFDWQSIEPVIDKIEEEIAELREAMASEDTHHIREEMGDVLFSCVNLSRHLDVDAEESLRLCNQKFENRFGYIEQQLQGAGRVVGDASLQELEVLWQEAKGVV